jgi:hypothetical protein
MQVDIEKNSAILSSSAFLVPTGIAPQVGSEMPTSIRFPRESGDGEER